MNKLNQLLQDLCPNGVEYKTINDCVDKISTIKWAKSDGASYQYIDLTSVDRSTHTITETQIINVENAPSRAQQIVRCGDILFGATRPMLKRYCMINDSFDGQICNTGFCVLRAKEDVVLQRWLYHNISSTDFFSHVEKLQMGASYPAISDADVKSYRIPVPPIEIQREIVRILDKFTTLSAELSARQKQYTYYRDKLLSFSNVVEMKKLGEVTRIFSASRVHKDEWRSEGVPFYRSSDIISLHNGVENSRGKAYISFELYEQLSAKSGKIAKDDILITGGGTIGIPYVVPTNEPLYMKDADLLCIQQSQQFNSRYLYHYFLSTPFRDYLKGITHDATIPHYTISQASETPVPLPSLEIQQRIVNVLDNFDAICSDLQIGLPAEIEARNKQFEYYRDKLLSFEPLA